MMRRPEPGFAPRRGSTPRIMPPNRGKPLSGDFSVGGEDFALVRRFEVRASAGPGLGSDDENVVDQIAFSRTWLGRRGLTPDTAGLVEAKGASMEPVIPDGALMLVRFGFPMPFEPAVYIFRHNDELFVKHLTVLESDPFGRPTRILSASQNTLHPPRVLKPQDDESFRVIARVVSVLADL